jgi:protein translocase SecG subunit
MENTLLVIHFGACFLLILSVLLQSSKGSAMGIFGGGGGGDMLFSGASGTSFVKKFTAVIALTIAVTSVLLTVEASKTRAKSVVDTSSVMETTAGDVNKSEQPKKK